MRLLPIVLLAACGSPMDQVTAESSATSAGLSATIAARAAAVLALVGDVGSRCPSARVQEGIAVELDGCSLPGGISLSGSASYTQAGLELHQLAAGAFTLDGTVGNDGLSITSGKIYVSYEGTMIPDEDGAGFTLDGKGVFTDDTPIVGFEAHALHQRLAACYADHGGLATERAGVFFDGKTPKTGEVRVTVAGEDSTWTLPTYGGCPPSDE